MTTNIITDDTAALIEAFFDIQHDRHVQDWRWYRTMLAVNPNYLDVIAARQTAKRVAGIGPEWRYPR